jgi:hypothetical protein
MAKNDIDILFENDRILLINKPSGISVTADRSGKADILQLLTKQLKPSEPLRLVHRLDKETSGVLLIAKHKEAQSRYSRLFAKRKVRKFSPSEKYRSCICPSSMGRWPIPAVRSRILSPEASATPERCTFIRVWENRHIPSGNSLRILANYRLSLPRSLPAGRIRYEFIFHIGECRWQSIRSTAQTSR